jgi:hypothetical protein
MPYYIQVRSPYTSVSEDAAVKTAFDTLITALKAASTHKVDAGGTVIGLKAQTADEANNPHFPHGTVW